MHASVDIQLQVLQQLAAIWVEMKLQVNACNDLFR